MSNAAGDQADIANRAASTDASNAASAYGAAQGDIGSYLSNINSAIASGNPYESKDYLTQQNLETSGAMNSQNDAAQQQEQATVARTGTNSAALPNEIAAQARTGQRDLTAYNAGRNTENEGKWLQERDALFGDQARGAGLEEGLYGTSIGGQDSTLSTAQQGKDAQEAATDGMINAAIGAAGAVGGGLAGCPAEGSPYLMADGTEAPVEDLRVGDQLLGIDGEAQDIKEIESVLSPVVVVKTANGYSARNSYTHAFARPAGGFVEAIHALGARILTNRGKSEVVSVTEDGTALVFNVITNGSHTYRASGVWSLGVGEAERQVTMDELARISSRIKAA